MLSWRALLKTVACPAAGAKPLKILSGGAEESDSCFRKFSLGALRTPACGEPGRGRDQGGDREMMVAGPWVEAEGPAGKAGEVFRLRNNRPGGGVEEGQVEGGAQASPKLDT